MLHSSRLPHALFLVATLVATACRSTNPDAASLVETVGDYPFFVYGLVVDAAGDPVPGAVVSLALDGVVYDVVTPLSEATVTTAPDGAFSFTSIAGGHNAPTLVRLTATHPDFDTTEVLEPYSPENPYRVTFGRRLVAPH